MRTSDALFMLIGTMTKAEKGYFKKHSALHAIGGLNDYVKLFDAIEKQSQSRQAYDEQIIKKNFDEKFNRQLPVVKNYLYNSVLGSLEKFHAGKSAESRVNSLIEQYDILFSRLLTRQAGELLKRAKHIAETHELFPELLKIISREKQFARAEYSTADFEKKQAQLEIEENTAFEKLKNLRDFLNLRYRIEKFVLTLGTGLAREIKQQEYLTGFLNDPLLLYPEKALSRTALILFNHYLSNIHSYLGNTKKSYEYGLRYMQLIEEDPGRTSNTQSLLASLNNVLSSQIRLKLKEESLVTLEKIKNFAEVYSVKLNEKEKAFAVSSRIILELSICMEFRMKERGMKTCMEAESLLTEYETKIPKSRIIVVYYFPASFLFFAGDYEASSKWLSKILLSGPSDYSSDYQCYARLMNLIVQYELRNFDHLDYAMRSTYYFLRKRNQIYKYEQVIIQYMKRAMRLSSRAGLIGLFDEMRSELETIYTDSFERNGFDAFNIIPWLEGKINSKTKSLK